MNFGTFFYPTKVLLLKLLLYPLYRDKIRLISQWRLSMNIEPIYFRQQKAWSSCWCYLNLAQLNDD